jgi:hypothetical protein
MKEFGLTCMYPYAGMPHTTFVPHQEAEGEHIPPLPSRDP